jgi:DNA repair ATPase RecN
VNGETQTQNFEILADPRSEATLADMQAQFDFLIDLRNKVSETHKAIGNIRKINKEINRLTKGLDQEKYADLIHFADSITTQLSDIEKTLYQTKNQSSQDPLNFPIRLNNKLAHLNSLVRIGDFRPTDQAIEVKNDISGLIDVQLEGYYEILEVEIPLFNLMVREMEVDFVEVD